MNGSYLPIKLAIFDVDGTLLRGDTICQAIARGLGKYERMCEMERAENEEQVAAYRQEMAGWYLDAGRDTVESHLTGIMWAPGARDGIAMLREAGVEIALASITWSFAVQHVATVLGIERYRSTDLDFGSGSVTHAWASTKASYLHEMSSELGVPVAEIAAVGDSSGDYEMLQAAGLPIFVGENSPGLQRIVHLPDSDLRDVASTILSFEK